MGDDRGIDAETPGFGEKQSGQSYRRRPGVYAVIQDGAGRIAVVQADNKLFLPGGGSLEGETPEETLRREIREECGREVEIGQPLGKAVESIRSQDGVYFRLECLFFEARFVGESFEPMEKDHVLLWVNATEAAEKLHRESQVWAVNKVKE